MCSEVKDYLGLMLGVKAEKEHQQFKEGIEHFNKGGLHHAHTEVHQVLPDAQSKFLWRLVYDMIIALVRFELKVKMFAAVSLFCAFKQLSTCLRHFRTN